MVVSFFFHCLLCTVAHICKHNKQFLKHDTIFLKRKSIFVKHKPKLSKHNTKLSKHNTKLSKHNTKLSKHNTKLSKHNKKFSKHNTKFSKHDSKLSKHNTKLSKQYIGETKHSLRERFTEHRQATNNSDHASASAAVHTHFNLPSHSVKDMLLIPLELRVTNNPSRRKARETYFIQRGQTLTPYGINRRNER